MNHKRKRPKNRRAGCLMCKNWKINGAPREWFSRADKLADIDDKEQREEFEKEGYHD